MSVSHGTPPLSLNALSISFSLLLCRIPLPLCSCFPSSSCGRGFSLFWLVSPSPLVSLWVCWSSYSLWFLFLASPSLSGHRVVPLCPLCFSLVCLSCPCAHLSVCPSLLQFLQISHLCSRAFPCGHPSLYVSLILGGEGTGSECQPVSLSLHPYPCCHGVGAGEGAEHGARALGRCPGDLGRVGIVQ